LHLGRIDTLHLARRATLDNLLGKSSIPAANVYPTLAIVGRQPIKKF